MKKLKYKLVYFLLSTIIFSCGNDDYSIEYIDHENKTEIIANLETVVSGAVGGATIPFTVTFPETLPSEATVTVRAQNKNNDGYGLGTAVLNSGETSVIVFVNIPENSAEPNSFEGIDIITAFVEGLKLTDQKDDPYVAKSNIIELSLYDHTGWDAPYPVDFCTDNPNYAGTPGLCDDVNEPWLVYNLDWEDASANDLDLYIYTGVGQTGEVFEYSESGSRFEGDFFNGNWFSDGVYYLGVNVYEGIDVSYRITTYDHEGNVTMKESQIAGGYVDVATITKSGGDSNQISYEIEYLID